MHSTVDLARKVRWNPDLHPRFGAGNGLNSGRFMRSADRGGGGDDETPSVDQLQDMDLDGFNRWATEQAQKAARNRPTTAPRESSSPANPSDPWSDQRGGVKDVFGDGSPYHYDELGRAVRGEAGREYIGKRSGDDQTEGEAEASDALRRELLGSGVSETARVEVGRGNEEYLGFPLANGRGYVGVESNDWAVEDDVQVERTTEPMDDAEAQRIMNGAGPRVGEDPEDWIRKRVFRAMEGVGAVPEDDWDTGVSFGMPNGETVNISLFWGAGDQTYYPGQK